MTTEQKLGLKVTGFFIMLSLIFLVLNLIGVLSWTVLWIWSPVWLGWGSLVVLGQVMVVRKYFSQRYWK